MTIKERRAEMINIDFEIIEGWVKDILTELGEEQLTEDYQRTILARGIDSQIHQLIFDQVRAEAYTLKRILGRK